MKKSEAVNEAADARSDLNIFYAVAALMESSLVSAPCYRTEARIVKICMAEAQRCLRRFDRAVAKNERLTQRQRAE